MLDAHPNPQDEAIAHFIRVAKLTASGFLRRLQDRGIHLSRDNLSSIAYSEELIFSMSATLQSTDRRHGIVG